MAGMPIPAEASAVHGICDADVAKAPLFKQIASELYDWMKGCDLGGYNSSKFDLPLLAEEFLRVGIQVDFTERSMVDVQQIFFKMWGAKPMTFLSTGKTAGLTKS